MAIARSLSDRLHSQHEAITAIVSGLDLLRLNKNPAPGKWSIHDNIAHLALYQIVFLERLRKMLEGSGPSFGRYRADEDPAFQHWLGKTTPELLEQMASDRKMIAGKILALPETELAKSGSHPLFGRLELPQWTEFFLLHEAHHMFTIFQLAHGAE